MLVHPTRSLTTMVPSRTEVVEVATAVKDLLLATFGPMHLQSTTVPRGAPGSTFGLTESICSGTISVFDGDTYDHQSFYLAALYVVGLASFPVQFCFGF